MARYVKCYRDFSGGLSEAANDNMADNQLAQARNIVPGDGYGIARAFGVSLAFPRLPDNDYNYRAAALVELTLADGTTQTLAFVSYPAAHQKLCRLNAAADGWQTVVDGLAQMKDYFVHAGKLYWLTGTAIKVYDGAAVSDLAITPAAGSAPSTEETLAWNKVKRAVAVEQRGQRWFYATPENEVIVSEIGDPAAIKPTNIVNVNTRDSDSITALQEFNNGLLVFKRRSVHYLSGWDFAGGSDIVLTRLNVTTGTAFPRTVRIVENAVLYLGANGVYRLAVPSYSSIVAATHISEQKISAALFREGPLAEAFAEVWENTYYLTVRSRETNAIREYRYFPERDAFFGEYTQPAACYALLGDNRLYLGLYNGYLAVYDRDSYHYINAVDGSATAIPVLAVTKGFDVAGSMAQDVKLKKVLVAARQYLAESSHLTVRVKADYADTQYSLDLLDLDESMVYGEGALGAVFWGWKDTVTKQLDINRKAKRVSFFLSDAHGGEPLLVYGLALLYKRRKVRGERAGVTRQQAQYQE